MSELPLVLSIQSHVVHGRSGNRSAVLPMEVSGISCDPFNTVHFSAHTAYKHKRGTVMDVQQFDEIVEGLELNNILPLYTGLMTGYVGNPLIVERMAELRKKMNKNVHYCCDPVLGDCGRFYVSKECLEAIKTSLVPIADTITPNAYEAEWLTDMKMDNQEGLIKIVEKLHQMGPKNVVISSTEWSQKYVFFSWNNGKTQIAIPIETLPRKFHGPGDLFSSLVLSNIIKYGDDYEKISLRSVNSTFSVLKRTFDMNLDELALPQSVQDILNPPDNFGIEPFDAFMKKKL